jgi:5-methylcytosine-specific restriction endonuclease McrBC GTP-binding regulatory subunit McrB
MMGQENYSQSTYLTNLAILAIFGYLKNKNIRSKYDNFEPFFSKKILYTNHNRLFFFFCRQVIKISPQKNEIIKI